MSTRRHFLGTLGKALGAGGLLLPWSGKGALALPADLGEAAKLPVTAAPMPFSAEALHLREIRRAMAAVPVPTNHPGGPGCPWYEISTKEYLPAETRLARRPVRSWTDCVELAETIWAFRQKDEHNKLYTGQPGYEAHLISALVEGVLNLGGGERFDPARERMDRYYATLDLDLD